MTVYPVGLVMSCSMILYPEICMQVCMHMKPWAMNIFTTCYGCILYHESMWQARPRIWWLAYHFPALARSSRAAARSGHQKCLHSTGADSHSWVLLGAPRFVIGAELDYPVSSGMGQDTILPPERYAIHFTDFCVLTILLRQVNFLLSEHCVGKCKYKCK